MIDLIRKRFPDYAGTIEKRIKEDHRFREICADYEEISTWLANYCRSTGTASEKCDHARELIKDLENEIFEELKAAKF